jgi:hypothetical protein
LSDQQINLGLVLWHPQQGFRVFLAPNLEGARSISPKVQTQDLRFRLNVIQEQISHNGKSGSEKLQELSDWFREGLEVTSPYPARFEDLDAAVHLLRPALFPQVSVESKELALVAPQALTVPHVPVTQFERKFFGVIEKAAKERHVQAHPVPPKRIGKVVVNPGFETVARKHKAFWRVISFRNNEKQGRQLAAAKAIAMDMYVLWNTANFKDHDRIVVVSGRKSAGADEPIAWLQKTANHVWPVEKPDSAAKLLDRALKSTS